MISFNEIKKLSEKDLTERVREMEDLPDLKKEKIDKETENLCYDRWFCESNRINYCNITNKDFNKIRLYVFENKLYEEQKAIKLEQ